MGRADALDKATGRTQYVADVTPEGCAHVAVVRSPLPRARILAVDASRARQADGVVGVYVAADLGVATYGRSVRDVPVLADGEARFVGERVAAVVAESRQQAEDAAALVDVDYEELPAVVTADEAVGPGAPLVHEAPWSYPGAAVRPEDGRNLQSLVTIGDADAAEAALAASAHVVDQTYLTRAGHQGYLEPLACVADAEPSGKVRVWLTNKSPYRLRSQLSACLGIEPDLIDVQPITLGGDFGGKGSPEDAPLCVALSRLTGRPVKLVLRYEEDLTSTSLRHPASIRVRVGCDADGRLTALWTDALLNGGAYGGYKPSAQVSLHGVAQAPGYRLPVYRAAVRIAYTNTVPKGHMRSPGAPQYFFAVESALDELAQRCGLPPVELRRRNLLRDGDVDGEGARWVEHRGEQTLDAAVSALDDGQAAPPGWLTGRGCAMYRRPTGTGSSTSLRLVPRGDAGVRVEVPLIETGTGAHTVVREFAARALGLAAEQVEVVQVATGELPPDPGVGGSRVTAALALALDQAGKAWREQGGEAPLTVVVDEPAGAQIGSYATQAARVAVDPATGQIRVLEIVSAVDVAEIVNPRAHQMQIDGGTVMGFGFACLEDVEEAEGQVFAAHLGEFKLPSARDVPALRTVLVRGGQGVGSANVKNIGESANVATAAAIANAVAAATGRRIRELPLTAERVYTALHEDEGREQEGRS